MFKPFAFSVFFLLSSSTFAVQPGTSWLYEGITTTISPSSGLAGLDNHCKTEFGPDARMCFSTEVVSTSNWPVAEKLKSTRGWMRPVFIGSTPNPSVVTLLFDFSGTTFGLSNTGNCQGWSSNLGDNRGVTVDGAGKINSSDCDVSDDSVGVACCLPNPDSAGSDAVFCNGFESCPNP